MECSQKSTSVSGSAPGLVISMIFDASTSCLKHIVNLTNVDVMGHITKIAAVENATTIWEYDPDLYDNHVLGGSLDVIAAVRTIAIKVCFLFFISILLLKHTFIRYRRLGSELNISKNFKSTARLTNHSGFPCTVMFDGVLPITCWTGHLSYAR